MSHDVSAPTHGEKTSSDKTHKRVDVRDCWLFMVIGLYSLWLEPSIKLQGMNQRWLWRGRWCWIWPWFKWDIHGVWAFLLLLYTRVNSSLLSITWKLHFGLTAPVLFWFPGVHCQINVRGRMQVRACIHVILYHSMAVWNYYEVVLQIKLSISHLWLL